MIATSRLTRVPALERGITIGDFLVPVAVAERIGSRFRHVALIVAGALLIALSANFSIPLPGSPVPITGQTFGVLLVGGALGYRRGLLATLLYLAMGLLGFPCTRSTSPGRRSSPASMRAGSSSVPPAATCSGSSSPPRSSAASRSSAGIATSVARSGRCSWATSPSTRSACPGSWPRRAGRAERPSPPGLTPFLIGDAIKLLLAAGLFPVAWWVVGRRPDDV